MTDSGPRRSLYLIRGAASFPGGYPARAPHYPGAAIPRGEMSHPVYLRKKAGVQTVL